MPEMEVIAVVGREDDRGDVVVVWAVLTFGQDGEVIACRMADIAEIPNTEVGALDTMLASVGMLDGEE